MSFPANFTWGAASSAYQIEGAWNTDGRGPSIWDTYCHAVPTEGGPGFNPVRQNVYQGHTGDTACDHYNRYKEDVAIMKSIGLKAYRFSIAWTRIFPEGAGALNTKGLDFYDRLVNELLASGITPFATLFHWDYPEALFRKGGWLNRESVKWFADYTQAVADRLGDRVTNWMTLNEPQVFLQFGHADAHNAPGLRLPTRELLVACHHALMSHGTGVQVLRARCKGPQSIGFAPVCVTRYPATDSTHDQQAAIEAMGSITERNLWNNTWYADAIVRGHYPQDGLQIFGADAPKPLPGDMELISQKIDFIGVNIYEGTPVRRGENGKPAVVERHPTHPTTAFRWPVEPKSLHWGPRYTAERYKLPVYITENGMSGIDWVSMDGKVHDPQRIDFTRRYLLELREAIRAGSDIRGYFHWSILDNFEWSQGYKERFGLVHVDYATQKRTPKDSAAWYQKVIASNGKHLDTDPFV
ncbi:MAG: GH1 family beta-glucosidase [Phycisphaerales bacterium]|nr:beta-glucosidase [Planctomycetota bacterium]